MRYNSRTGFNHRYAILTSYGDPLALDCPVAAAR